MVEAAYVDGKIDEEEIEKILNLLEEKFNQDSLENKKILDKCLKEINEHKSVESVRYPFRIDHPDYEIATKQMKAGGAIITIKIKANQHKTYSFCKDLRYFTMAESLGGIESLICHPATMTHSSVSPEIRMQLGINDSLIRFSVGCEDIDDLSEDLHLALEKIK